MTDILAGLGMALPVTLLAVAAIAEAAGDMPALVAWVRAALCRRHDPRRQVIGGFRCTRCHLAGRSYEDFGLEGGHVSTRGRA